MNDRGGVASGGGGAANDRGGVANGGGGAANGGFPWRPSRVPGQWDPAEAVARVALAKRDVLLRVHRRRLRREDLEDCYSQATLELVARARRDETFASPQHVSNALEQKFASRINDRHRAISGRSATEAALAGAVSLNADEPLAGDVPDHSAEVADRVAAREELVRLREVASELTHDQRLVLFHQVALGMDSAEACRRLGWSSEKFRKVAQRARAKLRLLSDEYDTGQRCRRLEADLLAHASGVASASQAARARSHLSNCTPCARHFRELSRATEGIAALLPPPVAVGGALAKILALLGLLRQLWPWAGRAPAHSGAGALPGAGAVGAAGVGGTAGAGAAFGVGGSALGVGALKVGLAAVCLAGAAGGYAVCHQAGLIPGAGHPRGGHHARGRAARTHTSSGIAQAATAAFAWRVRFGSAGSSPAVGRSAQGSGRAGGRHEPGRAVRTALAARREFGFEGSGARGGGPSRSGVASAARVSPTAGSEFAPRGGGSATGAPGRRASRAAAREFGGG
jgi:DNA-directed RNA polymerase specialized sigma24 family protein